MGLSVAALTHRPCTTGGSFVIFWSPRETFAAARDGSTNSAGASRGRNETRFETGQAWMRRTEFGFPAATGAYMSRPDSFPENRKKAAQSGRLSDPPARAELHAAKPSAPRFTRAEGRLAEEG